ncbi:MAG TPA: transglutaminase family protein [Pyrinomonadaceae bacterium]|nr:transglutaminase family protein [Pyrinomonadaceae bacterium]
MAMDEYLRPTEFLDSDHVAVREYAAGHTEGLTNDRDRAVALYYAVRDGFQYDPYLLDLRRSSMKASSVLSKSRAYCVEKAVLLAASARSLEIPARLSFYIVRNHIATERLVKALEKDYLVFHGAAEMYLEGKWVKATPAFNKRLCDFLGVDPIDFDGRSDAIFQEYDKTGNVFMEYLHEYGAFNDVPYELFLDELDKHYPHLTNNPRFVTEKLVYDFRR